MAQQFVFDTRLPVSEHTSNDDPNHPKNVMRTALMTSNQASADSKYDIVPPPRVEAFVDVSPNLMMIASCLVIVISLAFLLHFRSTPIRVVCIGALLVATHYVVYVLENRTM